HALKAAAGARRVHQKVGGTVMKRAVRNKWRLLVSVLTLSLATLGGGLAASGTWASTGAMNTARWDHTATLLLNGEVLVSGGENRGGTLARRGAYHSRSG